MPDADRDAIMRRLEDQALTASNLRLELQTLARDLQQPIADFRHFVMDPEVGLVVRVRHLEANLKMLDEAVAQTVGLDARLVGLEDRAKRHDENKQWVTRDVLVAGVLAVVTAVVASLIISRLHF